VLVLTKFWFDTVLCAYNAVRSLYYKRRCRFKRSVMASVKREDESSNSESEREYRCPFVYRDGQHCDHAYNRRSYLKDLMLVKHTVWSDSTAAAGFCILQLDNATKEHRSEVAKRNMSVRGPWAPASYDTIANIPSTAEPIVKVGRSRRLDR
jgi:hypothetical protein